MKIKRLLDGPIIRPNMDDKMGDNINGPSLIRVPDWVDSRLGLYYLYFSHHDGSYIRLAYADDLLGPWKTYVEGVLPIAQSHFAGHVASPDVHVIEESHEIRMYYHGANLPTGQRAEQATRVAISTDGLHFEARPELLGRPYFRVFKWRDYFYALAMPGHFYRSGDGLTDFTEGPTLFTSNMRHTALKLDGNILSVFYTNAGDCPERILLSTIDLLPDWMEWTAAEPVVVLKPERDYEGGNLPKVPSKRGQAIEPVCQLRDPAIFREGGRTYLLYSVAGERGIAIAQIDGD